ncbi:MAG: SgcJ/EcaC family oxidoreductase, partial [Desulfobulbia bacterium]
MNMKSAVRYLHILTAAYLVAFVTYARGEDPQVNADRALIQEAAVEFVTAYNNHDAKAAAALFAEDAELLEQQANRFVGRDEIEMAFVESFERDPKSKISLLVNSIRFVTPDVAVEEGEMTWYPDGETPTTESTYRVAHVKRGDK